jgi:hypothetical protein
MTSTTIKVYRDLISLETFEERLEYLRLGGGVGRATFGSERYLNQKFYTSYEWKQVRNLVITRDNGCDLGVPGYEIHSELLIHHMNPLSVEDIREREYLVLDPNNLITTTHATHNAIHYSGRSPYPRVVTERTPNDTKLW